jgi:acyl dehydratase
MVGQLVEGTFEEARALVGCMTLTSMSSGPVNEAMIKYFASSVEDGNPSYWDPEFAHEAWGGVVSPPAMLAHWVLPPPWSPGEPSGGYLAPPLLMTSVPLPGDTVINVSVDYAYLRPILVGDRLHMVEKLEDVSPARTTRLGTGHFVTTSAVYMTQDDEIVATQTNVLFRYSAGADDD